MPITINGVSDSRIGYVRPTLGAFTCGISGTHSAPGDFDGSLVAALDPISVDLDGQFAVTQSVDGDLSPTLGDFTSRFISTPALDPFPHPCAGRIGQRSWGDDPTQTGTNFDRNLEEMNAMGRTYFSVINGQPSSGSNRRAAMLDWTTWANANYPGHTKYQYYITQETGGGLSGTIHNMLVEEDGPPSQTVAGGSPVPQNCWYARDGSGNLEAVFGSNLATNLTGFVVPNTDVPGDPRLWGEKYVDEYFQTFWVDPFVSAPFDGFYQDVTDHRPREDGLDYKGVNYNNGARNGDGSPNGGWDDNGEGEEVADAYRDGNSRAPKRINQRWPGQFVQGANRTTNPRETEILNPRAVLNSKGLADDYAEYKNLFGMYWNEGLIVEAGGFGFVGMQADGTLASFGSPRMAWNSMRWAEYFTPAPGHVLNQMQMEVTSISRNPMVSGFNIGGGGSHCTRESAEARLFIQAMNALGNGYFYCGIATASNPSARYNYTAEWDEDGFINNGTTGLSGIGWLGQPLEASLAQKEWDAQDAVFWIANGEFQKRRFQNGVAINRWDKPPGSTGSTISGVEYIPIVTGGSWENGEIPSNTIKELNGVQYRSTDPIQPCNANRVLNETNFPLGYPMRRMTGRFFENV